MYKNGHMGMSLLLSSPIVALLLVLDLYFLAGVFVFTTVVWCSVPDVDMPLKNYDSLGIRTVPILLYHYVLVTRLALVFHNLAGKHFMERVEPEPQRGFTISHRGITHTFWWASAFGVLFGGLFATILGLLTVFLSPDIVTVIYGDILNTSFIPAVLLVTLAGFCAVSFHIVGDVFTPTGIHYWTLRTDYGYSFNQFYAKNEVANRSAFPIGAMGFIYALFFGFSFGEIDHIYLVGGFIALFVIGIPIWLVFVRTRIGRWFYTVYDFFN